MTDLRIVEFRASNFARLKAVEIRPQGSVVKISGANRAGKTSCLHAIEAALKGRAGAPAEPIRQGTQEAELHLNLGDIVIERTIRRSTNGQADQWALTVRRADGSRISKTPQAVIDAFYSALTIDPLAFARAEPKQQAEMLSRLVDFDFAGNAADRLAAYNERTIANRRFKEQSILAEKTVVPPGPKPVPIDVSDTVRKLAEATEHNNKVSAAIERRKGEWARADEMLDRAEKLRAEAVQLERDAYELQKAADDSEKDAVPPIDTSQLIERLSAAEQNRMVLLAHETRASQEKLAQSFSDQAAKLTEEINQLDAERNEAIAGANLPAGLSFSEEGVFYKDLPFAQASSAETIEVACAVAMALSPQLKVILVDGGERLDKTEMKVLEAMAAKSGYDLWITIVDQDGTTGFVIEDGALK